MKFPDIASGARSIIARIVDLVVEAGATNDVQIELRGSRMVLTADLGQAGGQPSQRRVRPVAVENADGVSPEAVLAVLGKHPGGFNLVNLARMLGIKHKTALRPIIDRLVAEGQIEVAHGKTRLPGLVRRGRPIKQAKVAPPIAKLVTPKKAAVKLKPAAKPPKKPASARRPPVAKPARPVKRPASLKPAGTAVTADRSQADGGPTTAGGSPTPEGAA